MFPFLDDRTAEAAKSLGLPADASRLADLVPRSDFTRLLAAIVRTQLEKDGEDVLETARKAK